MSSHPLVPIDQLLRQDLLEPVFGPASAQFVVSFLKTDFAPFADSFPPLVGRVQRDGKGVMVSCSYPLAVKYDVNPNSSRESGSEPINIGVLFTQAFPQLPPQVALLLSGKQSITPGHPFVAPNGAVRTALLDCGASPRSMFDILAAVINMMQSTCPLLSTSTGRGIFESISSPAASQTRTNQHQGTTPTSSMAGGGGGGGQQHQQSPSSFYADPTAQIPITPAHSITSPAAAPPTRPAPTSTPQRREEAPLPSDPLTQSVLSALLAQVKQVSEHYITARDGLVGYAGGIEKEMAEIEKELGQIELYEQEVQILRSEYVRCKESLTSYTQEVGPLDGLSSVVVGDCIRAKNDLHEQALELLASIHAHQDQLTILERALSKGCITSEQYLRYVSTISREEFRCRALYRTVHNHIQKAANEAQLLRTHRRDLMGLVGSGADEKEVVEMVRDTLAANNYDPDRASRALESMVRS